MTCKFLYLGEDFEQFLEGFLDQDLEVVVKIYRQEIPKFWDKILSCVLICVKLCFFVSVTNFEFNRSD